MWLIYKIWNQVNIIILNNKDITNKIRNNRDAHFLIKYELEEERK